MVHPTFFYASFRRVGRLRFRGQQGVGFRKNKVLGKNLPDSMEAWKLLHKRLCRLTLLARKEPVNTFATENETPTPAG